MILSRLEEVFESFKSFFESFDTGILDLYEILLRFYRLYEWRYEIRVFDWLQSCRRICMDKIRKYLFNLLSDDSYILLPSRFPGETIPTEGENLLKWISERSDVFLEWSIGRVDELGCIHDIHHRSTRRICIIITIISIIEYSSMLYTIGRRIVSMLPSIKYLSICDTIAWNSRRFPCDPSPWNRRSRCGISSKIRCCDCSYCRDIPTDSEISSDEWIS